MIKVALVGLGKMGISHLSIFNAHPDVEVVGVCDSSRYIRDVLAKYTGLATFGTLDEILATSAVDAVVIATPSSSHAALVRQALASNIHVFCEKPLTLDAGTAADLAADATARGLVTQVGYHNRFVGAFREVKRLLDAGAIGQVSHALAEAYGPVVLKPQGGTWRSDRRQGGGCLYDYAAHAIDLLNWYLGEPVAVGGSALSRIFSRDTEDQVSATIRYRDATAQLSADWSDESHRKMTTRVTLWGSTGTVYADRQEMRLYLREAPAYTDTYHKGWNVRYTTELSPPVDFYLRGEEYSAQVDEFVGRVSGQRSTQDHSFSSAAQTDRVIGLIMIDAAKGTSTASPNSQPRGHSAPSPGADLSAQASDLWTDLVSLVKALSARAHAYIAKRN